MSAEAQVPAPQTTTAEPAAPAAAPEAGGKGGQKTSRARAETFRDAMERIGGDEVFTGERKGEPAPAAEAEPGGEAPPEQPSEEKPQPAVDPKAEKLAELRALAKELGFQLDDAQLTNAERAQWRKVRKEHTEAISAAEREASEKINELRKAAEAEIQLGKDIKEARKNRDFARLAKLLEYQDWNALQDDVIAAHSDPNYQRLLELEQWKQQQEQENARAAEESKKQREAQELQQRQQAYRVQLTETMKGSADPLVKAFHDDPVFVNAIFRIQEEDWKQNRGAQVVTPERAIHMKAPGATQTLHDQLRGIFDRLSPVFAAKAEEAPAEPKKPKRTPEPPKPPAPSKRGFLGEKEERARFRQMMEDATLEDRRAERRARTA